MDKGVHLRKDLIYQRTRGWRQEVGSSLYLRDHAKSLKNCTRRVGAGAPCRNVLDVTEVAVSRRLIVSSDMLTEMCRTEA